MPKGIKTRLKEVIAKIGTKISSSTDGKVASGLASEGYAGGYSDALSDVLLLLNDVEPERRDYWKRDDDEARV